MVDHCTLHFLLNVQEQRPQLILHVFFFWSHFCVWMDYKEEKIHARNHHSVWVTNSTQPSQLLGECTMVTADDSFEPCLCLEKVKAWSLALVELKVVPCCDPLCVDIDLRASHQSHLVTLQSSVQKRCVSYPFRHMGLWRVAWEVFHFFFHSIARDLPTRSENGSSSRSVHNDTATSLSYSLIVELLRLVAYVSSKPALDSIAAMSFTRINSLDR